METISQRIMDFGFTQDEANYYVFLSLMGPTPIRTLVRRFDSNRVKVYRTLKKLEERGFVERTIGRPVRYVAAPLEDSLQKSIENIQTRLTGLEEARKEILDQWSKLSEGLEPELEEPRFRIHQGRQQIYEQLLQMCGKAEREISLVTTEKDLHRLALFGLDDALRSRVGDGVKINIMTQVESIEFEEIGKYYQFTASRHVPLTAPARFVVIDDSEALVTVSMEDSMSMTTQNDTGLWTNSVSFISIMKVFYNALWSLASETPSVIKAMKTGKALQEMKTLRTREEFQETLIEMVVKCSSSLDIVMRDLSDPPALLDEVSSALQRNVNCRILTVLNIDNMDKFREISAQAKIKHFTSTSTMNLLVTDGTEALMNIPSWQARNQSLWSDMTAYVETGLHMFEDHWESGEPVNDAISRLGLQRDAMDVLQKTGSILSESDWSVESPGILAGNSGVNHMFNLVAKHPENPERLAFDLIDEENPSGNVAMTGTKKVDLTKVKVIMIFSRPVGKEVEDLAKLFGIQLVGEADLEEFLQGISNQ